MIIIILISTEDKKEAGETLERDVSDSFVHPGGTFTLTYQVQNPAPPFFFSIKDVISGGCTSFGTTDITTTLTSPQTATGAITITAPATTGTCTFNGDWKLGANPEVGFTQDTVTVCNKINCIQSAWSPNQNTVCPGFGFTQSRSTTTSPNCGGAACGPSTQGSTGNKNCGTTPSITATDTFQNGCNGGTAGTCNSCFTYGDGFNGACSKDINGCNGGVDRSELGCTAQEWIEGGGQSQLRRYMGDSSQNWIDNGGPE